MIRGENDDLHLVHPQINQQKDKVLWFENGAGGPHLQAMRAMLWNLKTDQISTVFSEYEEQQPVIKSLFIEDVSRNYWTLDGEHAVLTTINHSRDTLFVLNVIDKTIRIVDVGLEDATVLNLKNDLLAIAASSPNQPPVVKIGHLDLKTDRLIAFKQLREKQSTKDETISYRIIKQNEDKPLEQVETILIGPTETFDKPTPAVIYPHGGKSSLYDSISRIISNCVFVLLIIN